MAKWHLKTDSDGNQQASFHDTVHGIAIDGYLHDCDGEFVAWAVYHNGELYQNGTVYPVGDSSSAEEAAWDEAMVMANAYICAIPGYPMMFAFPPRIWMELNLKEATNGMSFEKFFNRLINDTYFSFRGI